jgi:hypothetical protein
MSCIEQGRSAVLAGSDRSLMGRSDRFGGWLVAAGVFGRGRSVHAIAVGAPAHFGQVAAAGRIAVQCGPLSAIRIAAVALRKVLSARVQITMIRTSGYAGFLRIALAIVRLIGEIARHTVSKKP